jgi:type I restriction-modification system DNA methylase subunit
VEIVRRAARRHGCASQYKDYVLVLLFVKYVSDKYAGDPTP